MIFQTLSRVKRYETSDKYFAQKMAENSSASEHVLRMCGYQNHLNQVGVNLLDKIVIDRVLQSLSPSYQNFMMNYNMQGMTKTIPKLFAMLKSAKVEVKKEHQVLVVNVGHITIRYDPPRRGRVIPTKTQHNEAQGHMAIHRQTQQRAQTRRRLKDHNCNVPCM